MGGCWGLQAVKPDGHIFRRPLKRTDKCSDGFLQDKERGKGRSLGKEKAGKDRRRSAV